MTTPWTPGPWNIERGGHEFGEAVDRIGPVQTAATYADDAWLDVGEPDAQLIALAPEMAEAILWHDENEGPDHSPRIEAMAERLRQIGVTKDEPTSLPGR